MPATVATARDEMLTLLKAAVDASIYSTMVLIWDGVENQTTPPEIPTPWARVSVKHVTGRQTSLSGALGTKRWTRGGFLVVQFFTPAGKGRSVSDDILNIILGAYEGKTTPGGLLFRNARFTEIGVSGPWDQTNVTIDFEYDQYK